MARGVRVEVSSPVQTSAQPLDDGAQEPAEPHKGLVREWTHHSSCLAEATEIAFGFPGREYAHRRFSAECRACPA